VTLLPLFFVALSAMLLAVAVWIVVRPLRAESDLGPDPSTKIETLVARHCTHFAQMRQALATEDFDFIRRRLPKKDASRLRRERQRALQKYLDAIGEDFARLDRMARILASLSPKVERREELERLKLELRFRILFRVARIRVLLGVGVGVPTLGHLADVVAGLSRQVETLSAWQRTVESS
jgi:hypothetical protein